MKHSTSENQYLWIDICLHLKCWLILNSTTLMSNTHWVCCNLWIVFKMFMFDWWLVWKENLSIKSNKKEPWLFQYSFFYFKNRNAQRSDSILIESEFISDIYWVEIIAIREIWLRFVNNNEIAFTLNKLIRQLTLIKLLGTFKFLILLIGINKFHNRK